MECSHVNSNTSCRQSDPLFDRGEHPCNISVRSQLIVPILLHSFFMGSLNFHDCQPDGLYFRAYIAGANYWFFWLISFCPEIACNILHRKLITNQSILSSFFSKGLNEVLYPIMCLIQLSSLPKKQRIIVSHLLPLGRDRYRLL